MKTALKVIGKIVKWYMILNTIVLAYIGAGAVVQEVVMAKDVKMIDTCETLFERTWFWLKGIFC